MTGPGDQLLIGQRERLLTDLGALVAQPLDVDVTGPIRRLVRDRAAAPGVRASVAASRRRPRPQLVRVAGGSA